MNTVSSDNELFCMMYYNKLNYLAITKRINFFSGGIPEYYSSLPENGFAFEDNNILILCTFRGESYSNTRIVFKDIDLEYHHFLINDRLWIKNFSDFSDSFIEELK